MNFPPIPTFNLTLPAFPTYQIDPCSIATYGALSCPINVPNVTKLPSWITQIAYNIGLSILKYILAWILWIPQVLGYYWILGFQNSGNLLTKGFLWIINAWNGFLQSLINLSEQISTQTGIAAPIVSSIVFGLVMIAVVLASFGIIRLGQEIAKNV